MSSLTRMANMPNIKKSENKNISKKVSKFPLICHTSGKQCEFIASKFYKEFPSKLKKDVNFLFYENNKTYMAESGLPSSTSLSFISTIYFEAINIGIEERRIRTDIGDRRRIPPAEVIAFRYRYLIRNGLIIDPNGIPATFYIKSIINQATDSIEDSEKEIARLIVKRLIDLEEIEGDDVMNLRDESYKYSITDKFQFNI